MDNNIDNPNYDSYLEEELDLTDEYSKMMREYVNALPDSQKNVQTYDSMRSLKRLHGVDAKQFMWLSDSDKREMLGIYNNNNINLDYNE